VSRYTRTSWRFCLRRSVRIRRRRPVRPRARQRYKRGPTIVRTTVRCTGGVHTYVLGVAGEKRSISASKRITLVGGARGRGHERRVRVGGGAR